MDTVEQVRITVLVDNHVDMLLTPSEGIQRFGLLEHFAPPHGTPICTENGIAYWIELRQDGRRHHVLFDSGLTEMVLLHNLRALGRSTDQLDIAVLSHGHPDHFGGLLGVLGSRREPLPIAIHPDAFLPKYFMDARGEIVMRINRGLDRDLLERAGARIVDSRAPVPLGPGAIATGQIERDVPFEPPVPVRDGGPAGVFLERDGRLVDDDAVIDDQAVVVNVAGKGLIVMTACGHAGVINTIRQAQRVTGVDRVHAVMGGFHTGFPGVPAENAARTIEALAEFSPQIVAPMHCSGLRTIALAMDAFPDQFVHNVAGTTIVVGEERQPT